MIALFALASPTHAWVPVVRSDTSNDPYPGNALQMHLVVNDFNNDQQDTIHDAIKAWNAGLSTDTLRGATWVTLLADQNTPGDVYNKVNEIFVRSDQWLVDNLKVPPDTYAAIMVDNQNADPMEIDIIINSDFSFCDIEIPSECSSNSLGQTIVHELGHAIGFGHDIAIISTMDTKHPFGGELGHYGWNIHENDYAGLRWLKPGVSTGFNITLGKFSYLNIYDTYTPGDAKEQWTEYQGATYFKSQMAWEKKPPMKPALVYQGPGSRTVRVNWSVSVSGDCSPNDPVVGVRFPNMGANIPYVVGPNSWNFSSVPPGDYYLCVQVDPNGVLNETNEADNALRSDVPHIEVKP